MIDLLALSIPYVSDGGISQEVEWYQRERLLQERTFITGSAIIHNRHEPIFDEQHAELRLDENSVFDSGLLFHGNKTIVVHFRHKPQIVFQNGQYSIPSWSKSNRKVCGDSIDKLGVEMRRLILRLYSAAKNRTIDGDDVNIWNAILHDIDYADYCDQMRPPLPTIGRKLKSIGDTVEIRLVGGRIETLEGDLAKSLDVVRDGERFTVLFKRMKGNIVVFENVCPLNEVDVLNNEALRNFFV